MPLFELFDPSILHRLPLLDDDPHHPSQTSGNSTSHRWSHQEGLLVSHTLYTLIRPRPRPCAQRLILPPQWSLHPNTSSPPSSVPKNSNYLLHSVYSHFSCSPTYLLQGLLGKPKNKTAGTLSTRMSSPTTPPTRPTRALSGSTMPTPSTRLFLSCQPRCCRAPQSTPPRPAC